MASPKRARTETSSSSSTDQKNSFSYGNLSTSVWNVILSFMHCDMSGESDFDDLYALMRTAKFTLPLTTRFVERWLKKERGGFRNIKRLGTCRVFDAVCRYAKSNNIELKCTDANIAFVLSKMPVSKMHWHVFTNVRRLSIAQTISVDPVFTKAQLTQWFPHLESLIMHIWPFTMGAGQFPNHVSTEWTELARQKHLFNPIYYFHWTNHRAFGDGGHYGFGQSLKKAITSLVSMDSHFCEVVEQNMKGTPISAVRMMYVPAENVAALLKKNIREKCTLCHKPLNDVCQAAFGNMAVGGECVVS